MVNKIRVESKSDFILLEDETIKVFANNKEYSFNVSDVQRVLIITTDKGPLYDDMFLVVEVGKETAIFVMSEHPFYETFLFEQLGKILELDYNEIIQASMSVDNKLFVIYKNKG